MRRLRQARRPVHDGSPWHPRNMVVRAHAQVHAGCCYPRPLFLVSGQRRDAVDGTAGAGRGRRIGVEMRAGVDAACHPVDSSELRRRRDLAAGVAPGHERSCGGDVTQLTQICRVGCHHAMLYATVNVRLAPPSSCGYFAGEHDSGGGAVSAQLRRSASAAASWGPRRRVGGDLRSCARRAGRPADASARRSRAARAEASAHFW